MTETVGVGAESSPKPSKKRGSSGARKGLRIQRVFTTEGVHPYDEVTMGAARCRHDQLA